MISMMTNGGAHVYWYSSSMIFVDDAKCAHALIGSSSMIFVDDAKCARALIGIVVTIYCHC